MTDIEVLVIGAIKNSRYDAASNSVDVIVADPEGRRLGLRFPRGLVGMLHLAIAQRLQENPAATNETEYNFVPIDTIATGITPSDEAYLILQSPQGLQIPLTLSLENIRGLKAAIAELERLLAPRTGKTQ